MCCNRLLSLPGHLLLLVSVVAGSAVIAAEPAPRAALWNKLEKYTQPPPEFAGKLGDYRSPLKFADGTLVASPDDWPKRRREILALWTRRLGEWPPLVEKPTVKRLETVEKEGYVQ